MGIIKTSKLVHEFIRRDEEGNVESITTALDNVNLDIKEGQFIAILGHNGSGKSTLLNLMGGLDTADSGSIKIDGTDIVGMSEKDLSKFRRNTFGFIYQFYNLVSDLNVYENVEVCHWLGDKSIKIDDILDRVGMAEHKKKFPDELSGGMQQRVSIARAIAKNPKIYLFDDSFSALDYKTDATLRAKLKEKTSESTVMIVAQRISTILHAEQILVLDEGRIVGKGTHEELLEHCEVYRQIAESQLSASELGMEESEVTMHE